MKMDSFRRQQKINKRCKKKRKKEKKEKKRKEKPWSTCLKVKAGYSLKNLCLRTV